MDNVSLNYLNCKYASETQVFSQNSGVALSRSARIYFWENIMIPRGKRDRDIFYH